ncbi:TIGR02281 family clan AA aspartic protease [Candidatus Venteria ishoeyi]|uniref:retropepsin-like aspartic protease family protein n=1 Tax=Candidatus Venteria ishoeyi TaxID=1899563 RepID=UPI0025A5E225|nr:TIGR02281 family clan AA aspartic protease [Candidatus Venteria ishoeyi]MDM8547706.1 TIGR02281 family clan AA aspartic protease [Candidatus Venteria ishoeyi]
MAPPPYSNDNAPRVGKGMMIAAWALLLGLLTWFFADLEKQQSNPNSRPQSRTDERGRPEVVLQRNRYGHYVASGKINRKPVIFLLDTGATSVAVPQSVAKRLNLHRGAPRQVNTANGVVTAYDTQLDSVQLGNIVLEQVRGVITPNMQSNEILLGMSFLKRLEFTQRGDILILRH